MVEQNGREFMSETKNEMDRQAGDSIPEKLLGLNAQNISEHMKMVKRIMFFNNREKMRKGGK